MRERVANRTLLPVRGNEQWMKVAALYWPGLARVVLPGFPVADPHLVKALRDELDFVTDVDPAEGAPAVAPAFLKAVEDHAPALRQRHLATVGTCPFNHPNFAELGMGECIANAEPTPPGDLRTLPRDDRPLAGLYPRHCRRRLKALQYRHSILGGFLAGTDLALDRP